MKGHAVNSFLMYCLKCKEMQYHAGNILHNGSKEKRKGYFKSIAKYLSRLKLFNHEIHHVEIVPGQIQKKVQFSADFCLSDFES